MHLTGAFVRDGDARRRAELWAELDAEASSAIIAIHRGRVIGVDGRISVFSQHDAPVGERVYLGRMADGRTSHPVELRLVEDWTGDSLGLRELVGEVSSGLADALTSAVALANWRQTHRYCPRCAEPLAAGHAGWMLECAGCGSQHWPRTDPAVIVRVEDDHGRVLLGSNAAWENTRFSLLAGFVEPGESLEDAVRREVFEESGVRVTEPRYLASQGWPFPMSLMLGFSARAVSDGLTPDGDEILELRWFDRNSITDPTIQLPRRGSVARSLLEDWFGGPIEEHRVDR